MTSELIFVIFIFINISFFMLSKKSWKTPKTECEKLTSMLCVSFSDNLYQMASQLDCVTWNQMNSLASSMKRWAFVLSSFVKNKVLYPLLLSVICGAAGEEGLTRWLLAYSLRRSGSGKEQTNICVYGLVCVLLWVFSGLFWIISSLRRLWLLQGSNEVTLSVSFEMFCVLTKFLFFLFVSGHAPSYESDPTVPPPPMLVSAQYHIHTHGVFRGLQVSQSEVKHV